MATETPLAAHEGARLAGIHQAQKDAHDCGAASLAMLLRGAGFDEYSGKRGYRRIAAGARVDETLGSKGYAHHFEAYGRDCKGAFPEDVVSFLRREAIPFAMLREKDVRELGRHLGRARAMVGICGGTTVRVRSADAETRGELFEKDIGYGDAGHWVVIEGAPRGILFADPAAIQDEPPRVGFLPRSAFKRIWDGQAFFVQTRT